MIQLARKGLGIIELGTNLDPSVNVTGPEFDVAPQAIGVIRPIVTTPRIDPVQGLVSIVTVEEHSGNERCTETLRKNQIGHLEK